jgi:zinc transporter ZupT
VEGNRMKATIKKLSTQSQALTKVLESGNIVDRDSVDEAVHNIEFLVDSARRVTRGSAPLDKRNVSRLKTHVKELEVDIQGVDPKRVDFKNVALVDQNLKKAAATLRHLHQHAHRGAWRKFAVRNPLMEEDRGDVEESKTPLSRALVLAVIIDAAVDGMLIGLASAVARTSGILMAIATSIEMGFLGYAFACAVVKSLKCAQAMVVLALPPLVMVFSSGVAAWSTDDVEQTPIFTGLIAFALVALLFLVVQELIVEAHEKEGGDLWYVSMFLYIGLVLSFAMDLVLQ